jgi:E3 ubiquitin-protein ligase HERC1
MEAGQYCTFVIHKDGLVSACGKGSYGRLGLGSSSNQPVPCRLTFEHGHTFRHISSSKGSDGHTLALTTDGRVYSWGDGTGLAFFSVISAQSCVRKVDFTAFL